VLADEGQRNRALTAQSGMSLKPDRGGYGAVFATMTDPARGRVGY
jgi:hypothetical protein